MRSRRSLFICSALSLISLFTPFSAIAQTDTSSLIQPYSAWTVDFGIQSNFTLGSFLGSALSVSHFSDRDSKWQFGLALGVAPDNRDESLSQYNDTSYAAQYNRTSTNGEYSLSLTAQRIYYSDSNRDFRFYAGGGPVISGLLISSNSDSKDQAPVGRFTTHTVINNSARSFSGGMSLLAGVEWQFAKQMSLHAHYGLNLLYVYTWTKERNATSDFNNPPVTFERIISSSGLRLASAPVMFGISLFI